MKSIISALLLLSAALPATAMGERSPTERWYLYHCDSLLIACNRTAVYKTIDDCEKIRKRKSKLYKNSFHFCRNS